MFLWEKARKQWRNWRAAGASARVLKWIKSGVPCYWETGPPKARWHKGNSCVGLKPEEESWLEREEERCQASGAWKRISEKEARYVSKAFLVDKAGLDSEGRKRYRLVVDLRPLNVSCKEFHSRFETLSRLGTMIPEGEEAAFLSFDLADGYNVLQIDESHKQYFQFQIQGRYYQCECMPFGWNQAGWAFCTAMKVLTRLLRSQGAPTPAEMATAGERLVAEVKSTMEVLRVGNRRVALQSLEQTAEGPARVRWHILPYCDDYLIVILGATVEDRIRHSREARSECEDALDFLGLQRQPSKGQWEAKNWVHHLGLRIETAGGKGMFLVTPERVKKIRALASSMLSRAYRERRLSPAKTVAAFCGLVQSCYLAIPAAQLFQRSLHDD